METGAVAPVAAAVEAGDVPTAVEAGVKVVGDVMPSRHASGCCCTFDTFIPFRHHMTGLG